MTYNPRADSSDVPLDSDDRWMTRKALEQRVEELLREQQHVTVGIAEASLDVDSADVGRRLDRWEPRLRLLGRQQDTNDGCVYHWTIAELIAHEALYEWWSRPLRWPLGWWPWVAGSPLSDVPAEIAEPRPFSTDES